MFRFRLIVELTIVTLIAVYLIKISNTLEQLKLANKGEVETEVTSNTSLANPEQQEEVSRLHSLNEVNQHLSSLSANTKAKDLALAISEIDSWMIDPEFEKSVNDVLDKRVIELRSKVLSEVKEDSQKALHASNSKEANKLLNNIGLLISLYPMSEEQGIIEQARQLTDDHRKLAVNLEGQKRLRYNKWAVKQIEQALNGYHKKSSLWSPKKENKLLVDSLVENLAEIDPNLLEPIVLSLYDYALETTKESISESDKVSLAEKLTSPNTIRKTYEDL
jgi:hypothetical protein